MSLATEKSVAPLLATVEGLYGSLDLELPGDIAIRDLLPHLIHHPVIARPQDPKDPSQWTLGLKSNGQKFDSANTLYNYGVLEGTFLQLQPTDQWSEPLPEFEQELTLPNENKLTVIKNVLPKSLSSLFKKSGK